VVALVEWRGRRRREKLAASAGCFAGFRWLAAGAFAAGAAEAVGEKPLERVCPLIKK